MAIQGNKTLEQVVTDLGRYPAEAYDFLKEGLDFTVHRIHGEPSKAWKRLVAWMQKHDVSPAQLARRFENRNLPRDIAAALREIGGPDALDCRHVSGEQLCWGMRDLALQRWGFLASSVLAHWSIRSTRDFGEMVFALIDADLLQKQRDDRVQDFDDVYDFETAFDGSYRIAVTAAL